MRISTRTCALGPSIPSSFSWDTACARSAELSREPQSVVQDRSVYEDAEVFARNLREQGTMSERDWETYYGLYRTMAELLPAPDLVVYIQASVETLRSRIAARGRAFEAGISEEYLGGLNALYECWIEAFALAPVLVVPGDKLDFVARPGDLEAIAETVEERLRDRQGSLFPFGMG